MTRTLTRGLPALLALTLLPSGAWASGLSVPLVGTAWSGVTTKDAAAVHWNPGMLGMLSGTRLQLNGGMIWAHVSYERDRRALYQHEDSFKFALPLEDEDIDLSKSGKAEEVSGDMFLPIGGAFLSVAVPDYDKIVFGLGIYGSQGAVIQLPEEGPHEYHIVEAQILGLNVTPAVAFRPLEWLSIGAGLNIVIGGVGLRKTEDLASTTLLGDALANDPINQPNDFGEDAPPGVRELDVLSRPVSISKATAVGLSFNVGLAVKPADTVTVGLMYQHGASLVFEGNAYLDMDHDFFTKDLAFKGLEYPALVEGDAFVELPFPASLRLGVGVEASETLQLALQASWVMWSVIETLDVTLQSPDLAQPELGIGPVAKISLPRDYNDTVEVEALVGVTVDEGLELGFKAGYHSPMSPDKTMDLSGIDGHRLVMAVMGNYQATDLISLQLQLLYQQVLPRTVEASDYDRGNGTYALSILHLGGALTFSWGRGEPDLIPEGTPEATPEATPGHTNPAVETP